MRNLIVFFVVTALALCLASCGEETSSGNQMQVKGKFVQRQETVQKEEIVLRPLKKKALLPRPNVQNWSQISTGQDKCYNNAVAVECDQVHFKFRNQDGVTKNGTRSVVPVDKATLRDEVTGLLWMKQIKEDVSWYEAKLYCESLRMGSKTWRLPTTAELRSIINYNKVGPAIDSEFYDGEDFAFKESLSQQFWASKNVYYDTDVKIGTSEKWQPASAWIINFYDGFVEYTSRYNRAAVRCVADADA